MTTTVRAQPREHDDLCHALEGTVAAGLSGACGGRLRDDRQYIVVLATFCDDGWGNFSADHSGVTMNRRRFFVATSSLVATNATASVEQPSAEGLFLGGMGGLEPRFRGCDRRKARRVFPRSSAGNVRYPWQNAIRHC